MGPISKKAKKDIHEIWQRQVGEVYPRVFAHRIAGSEDLVRRLDLHAKLEKHKGCVNTVSFNAAGDILVSGSDDRSVVLWDWDAQHVKLSFHSGHSNNVFQAKIMPFTDDLSIVTCAADGQVRHAQIREGGQVDTIKLSRHRGRAHKLAIEPGSPHIFYTCGEDGVVQHFDLRTHTATKLFTCKSFNGRSTYVPSVPLNAVAIDPRNPNLFAIGGSDVYARVYDVRKYKWEGSTDEIQPTDCFCPTHLIGNDDVGITGLAFSDHSELLLSYNDELIYLFPKGTGLGSDPQSSSSKDACEGSEGPQVYKGHRNADTVKGVNFFGPNCEYVTSGSDCGRVFIWRKKDSQLVRVMEGDKDVVNCVEPHPHATVLATSGIESNIKIWTPKASEPVPLPTTIEEVKSDRRSRWSRFITSNDLMMHILSRSNAERQHNAGEDDNLEIVEYVMSLTDGDGSSDDGDAENSPDIQQLKVTHALVITNGYQQNPLLAAKLVSCYMDKGTSVNDGRLVFECTKERDVLLWNVMIQAYGTVGPYGEAVSLFQQMRTCIKPNIYTFPFVLKACAAMADGRKTKEIHADILKVGIEDNIFVCNSLISAYSRCGDIKAACKVFDGIFARDVISWNSMIVGYTQNDRWKEALMLFCRMLTEFPGKPDLITLLSILPACGQLAALQQGLWIHTYLIKNRLEIDMVLGSALIMMYSKCGCLHVARRVFDMIPERNVVLWNSIIGSYGFHGVVQDALELFSQMLETGMVPDDVTFVYVLSACSHAGCLARAWHYFDMMQNHFGIGPTEEHCACMVDMLGRAGKLVEAMSFIRGMSLEPGREVWGALLGACRMHNRIDLAEAAANELFALDRTDAGRYVLLANIYAAGGRWEDVAKVRRVMREGTVRKPLGCSMIEIERQAHAFGSYDRTHPLLDSI